MCIKRIAEVLLFFVLAGSVGAEMRTWNMKDGKSLDAEFVREVFGTMFLKDADRQMISIDLENLSDADLHYFRTMIPPEVDVGVSVKSQMKPWSEYRYKSVDPITIILTGTVKVSKKSKSPFDGTLRGEIYLVGEEVATDDYRMLRKIKFPIRFTEENKGDVTFKVTAEAKQYMEYGSWVRRGVKYSGYMVVITDQQGNTLQTSTNLRWMEKESLPHFRALGEGYFFNEYCWEVPTPRPPYYEPRRERY